MRISRKTRKALKELGFSPGTSLYPEDCLENHPIVVMDNPYEHYPPGRWLCRLDWQSGGAEEVRIVKEFRKLLKPGEAQDHGRLWADAYLTKARLLQVCRMAVKFCFCCGQNYAEVRLRRGETMRPKSNFRQQLRRVKNLVKERFPELIVTFCEFSDHGAVYFEKKRGKQRALFMEKKRDLDGMIPIKTECVDGVRQLHKGYLELCEDDDIVRIVREAMRSVKQYG